MYNMSLSLLSLSIAGIMRTTNLYLNSMQGPEILWGMQ